MPLKVQCPKCGKGGSVADSFAGKCILCKCGEKFSAGRSVQSPAAAASKATAGAGPRTKGVGAAGAAITTAPHSTSSDLPATIGRFQVRARLGAGAFGTVYRAYDPQLDREVALKVPQAGTLESPKKVERFLREAKAAAQLRHPHIVPIYDAGQDASLYYIASAFIQGQTLSAFVDDEAMDCQRAATLVRQLAEALHYAHELGIVHRDVKPANVMIDEAHGKAHLMDFGLAARQDSADKLTQDGAVLGTPAYMPPEQAAGKTGEALPASDQYSLGATLYELLCGQTPFAGPPEVVIYNVLNQEPPAPHTIKKDVPRDLETICLKAMAKRPQDRYASCQELANDLRRWQEGEPIRARRVGPVERLVRWGKRNPVVAGLSAATLLLLFSVAVGSSVALFKIRTAHDAAEAARASEEGAKRSEEEAKRSEDQAKTTLDDQKRTAATRLLTLRGHQTVKSVAYSPDGKRLATCGDSLIKIWDAATGQEVHSIRNEADVDCVAFSPDSLQLAAVGRGRGTVWDVVTGKKLGGFAGVGICVAYSRDGSRLVAVADLRSVKVFDAKTGAVLSSFPGDQEQISAVCFSPDDQLVAAARINGTIKIWEAATQKERATFRGHSHAVLSVTFSPDGKRLVSGGQTDGVRVWDLASAKEVFAAPLKTTNATNVAFTPDGLHIIAPNLKGIKYWNAATGLEVAQITQAHDSVIRSLAISGDGQRLITGGGDDGTAKVWDITSLLQSVQVLKLHDSRVEGVAFSPDGKLLAGVGYTTVKLWNCQTGQEEHTFTGLNVGNHVAFSPDGNLLAASDWGTGGGTNGKVVIWDLTRGQVQLTLPSSDGHVYSAVFSPNGKHLAAGVSATVDARVRHTPAQLKFLESRDAKVILWDAATGKEQRVITKTSIRHYHALAFHPKQELLLAGGSKGVHCWDLKTGQSEENISGHDVSSLAISPDGQQLVLSSSEPTATIWSVTSRKELATLKGHADSIRAVAWSPLGNLIATASADQQVKLWNPDTAQEIATLRGHTKGVHCVAFAPDGNRLASGSADGTVRIWRTRPD